MREPQGLEEIIEDDPLEEVELLEGNGKQEC